jgi:hypothetical protein
LKLKQKEQGREKGGATGDFFDLSNAAYAR